MHFVSENNRKSVHIACPNQTLLDWLNERGVSFKRFYSETGEGDKMNVDEDEEKEDEETIAIINEYN